MRCEKRAGAESLSRLFPSLGPVSGECHEKISHTVQYSMRIILYTQHIFTLWASDKISYFYKPLKQMSIYQCCILHVILFFSSFFYHRPVALLTPAWSCTVLDRASCNSTCSAYLFTR